MKKILAIALVVCGFLSHAQNYPKDQFSSPLQIPIYPSGTFGELRGNHFHAGLDIRTQQKIGLPIYAPADGTVSRIKVSTFGYGKALYVNHPGGFTTVYGHLNAYSEAIGKRVRQQQYKLEKFEVELFPKGGELLVKKGEIIAFTGNTGGSGGPHLHYEFRDTKTEKIINPLHFGLDKEVEDTQAPVLNGILVYALGDQAVVNGSQQPQEVSLTKQKDGSYLAFALRAQGSIGFAVNTHDTSNGNYAKNGIYSIRTYLNGSPFYSYQFDIFAFDESRYVNALIDYERYVKTNQRFQKLFYKKPYPFSVIQPNKNNGQIEVKASNTYAYRIEISDFNGNTTVVHLPIHYDDTPAKVLRNELQTPYWIESHKDYIFEKEGVSVQFPQNAFYDDFYLDFSVDKGVLKLHRPQLPIHKNLRITFDLAAHAKINRDKAFIGRVKAGKTEFFTTDKKGDKFSIRTRDFGYYTLVEDTVAPRIYKPSFEAGATLSPAASIGFSADDQLSGIGEIRGTINGKWILLEYDYKTDQIVHQLQDGIAVTGKNEVLIQVSDRMGNQQQFKTHFFIK